MREACAQRFAFEDLHDGVSDLTLPPEVVMARIVRQREPRDPEDASRVGGVFQHEIHASRSNSSAKGLTNLTPSIRDGLKSSLNTT